jgi:uncharacterized protein (DUF885 family)
VYCHANCRTHFDIPQPAHRIEAMIAPTNEGGLYYTAPSDDWSRPGQMWWSVPDGVEAFSTWKEVTVVYHEGVPGHHLQISHAMAQTESLNRWQRMSWVSGHGEGWALYAERLMGELGYLDDPGAYLGMLDSQQLLAVQVPLDIGVHLELDVPRGTGWREGERWNAEIAWELLRAHSSWDERQLRSELRRCLGMAGQAPSYTLGERIWLQAREDAMARAGGALASRTFTPRHSAWARWALTRCARRLPASKRGAGPGAPAGRTGAIPTTGMGALPDGLSGCAVPTVVP